MFIFSTALHLKRDCREDSKEVKPGCQSPLRNRALFDRLNRKKFWCNIQNQIHTWSARNWKLFHYFVRDTVVQDCFAACYKLFSTTGTSQVEIPIPKDDTFVKKFGRNWPSDGLWLLDVVIEDLSFSIMYSVVSLTLHCVCSVWLYSANSYIRLRVFETVEWEYKTAKEFLFDSCAPILYHSISYKIVK